MPEPHPLEYADQRPAASKDDLHYLRVIANCHIAFGGAMCLGAVMASINAPDSSAVVILAAMFLAGLWMAAAGMLFRRMSGFWLATSASVITIMLFPIGTILAIATIAVVSRRGVQAAFRKAQVIRP